MLAGENLPAGIPPLESGPVYAFWYSADYPYMLGGRVSSYDAQRDKVLVYIEGYESYPVQAIKIIAGTRGEAFYKRHMKLHADYRQAKLDLLNDFNAQLRGLCEEFEFTEDELPFKLKNEEQRK